jgi:3-oxoacyl-[acyl-carrier protein] reductase
MSRLEGKTALITGAARGLGARIAERFAEAGARVIINDLNLSAAKATADRLGGEAVACDVSDSASVAAMFKAVDGMTDRLDILVNNAGISGMEGDNSAARASPKWWRRSRPGKPPMRPWVGSSRRLRTSPGTA